MSGERFDWTTAPTVFLPAKVCPHCGHGRFINVWSEAGGDGSRTQRQVCRRCSGRVLFVFENDPPSGDHVHWPTDNGHHGD